VQFCSHVTLKFTGQVLRNIEYGGVSIDSMYLLWQVDEDLAKINVDDPRYQHDEQDGFANGVWLSSA